jgi:hypothetical protein
MRKILIPKRMLIVLMPIVVVLGLAVPAAAASITYGPGYSGWDNYYANPTSTSTWSGFCGGAGASEVTAGGVAAPACGPTGDDSISIPATYPYKDGGETTTPGFQCVELTDRYMYVTKHWGALSGDGADVVRVYGAAHGVTPIQNDSGQAPAAGDVISFSVESNFTDDSGLYPGHTAIVSSSNVNAAGTGSITILSENWGGTAAPATIGVSHWSVDAITTYDSNGVAERTPYVEWLPLAGSATSGFEVGAEASTNNLYLYSSTTGGSQLGLGMLQGTSPSLTAVGGTYDAAFQDNGGQLYIHTPSQNSPFGLGMMHGTSPSITTLTNGAYEVAFQDNGGDLYLHTPGQNTPLGLGFEAGTSPSIAPLPNGSYEVAFAANTGNLYLHRPGQNLVLTLGMMKGTSPSIAELSNGGYEVAFQANTGDLWTYSSTGEATDLGQMMAKGTSPSITASASGGFEIAFQGANGYLTTYSSASGTATNLEQGMMAGTSPSIATQPGGTFETAFQANTGSLLMVGAKSVATGLKMQAGTSPSIEG